PPTRTAVAINSAAASQICCAVARRCSTSAPCVGVLIVFLLVQAHPQPVRCPPARARGVEHSVPWMCRLRTLGGVTDSVMHRWRSRLARWIDPDTRPGAMGHGPVRPDGAATGTGLVIAGGGARSSFEIGALQYLYEHQRLDPVVISGTSAGSILAAVLAQHSRSEDQAQALERLERIWAGMSHSADMFAEQPWFTALRAHIPTWRKVMALRQRQANRVSLSASLTDLL